MSHEKHMGFGARERFTWMFQMIPPSSGLEELSLENLSFRVYFLLEIILPNQRTEESSEAKACISSCILYHVSYPCGLIDSRLEGAR